MLSVPCIESFPRLPTQNNFGLLKASGSQIYCSSSPRRKKPLESSESFDRTIAEVKQTRMFSVMADETADVSNKKNLLLTSAVSTLQRIFERSNAIKEETAYSVRDLSQLTMDNCRGQSYDGAGNMAGRYAGALTLIQHQLPKFILLSDKCILVETSHTNCWIHPW